MSARGEVIQADKDVGLHRDTLVYFLKTTSLSPARDFLSRKKNRAPIFFLFELPIFFNRGLHLMLSLSV